MDQMKRIDNENKRELKAGVIDQRKIDLAAKWEGLTIQDRFIFAKVMQDPANCGPFLQRLFPEREIRELKVIEPEKTVEGAIGSKSVRFDVFVKDETECAYTIEMQVLNRGNIQKRSRYYASMMDENTLRYGQEYDQLPPQYIIFICPFDLFGYGLHRYSFRNMCIEIPGLKLRDKTEKIFLNTKSITDDIPADLRHFLDYVDGKETQKDGLPADPFIEQLKHSVALAKMNARWRSEYMMWEIEMNYERKDAAAEGRAIVNRLNELLLNDERIEDLRRSTTDMEYQQELLKEYHLLSEEEDK